MLVEEFLWCAALAGHLVLAVAPASPLHAVENDSGVAALCAAATPANSYGTRNCEMCIRSARRSELEVRRRGLPVLVVILIAFYF